MNATSHIENESSEIFSVETGPLGAELIVLIHGALDRSSGMALLARQLQGSYRVLRYDRRGYGRSWPHSGPFGIDHQVQDLMELMNGRAAVVFGHSFGGNVALAAAQKFGGQITAVGTYETPMSWMPWWTGSSSQAIPENEKVEDVVERFMIRLIGERKWNELPEHTRVTRRREGLAFTQELASVRDNIPWDEKKIECKVISSHGSKGVEHHARASRWLAENMTLGFLEIIDGARHGAPNTHARELTEQVILPLLR